LNTIAPGAEPDPDVYAASTIEVIDAAVLGLNPSQPLKLISPN
jgi:hypothetical protein